MCISQCEVPDSVLPGDEGVSHDKYTVGNAYEKYLHLTSSYTLSVSRQQEVNIQLIIWEIATWEYSQWFNLLENCFFV